MSETNCAQTNVGGFTVTLWSVNGMRMKGRPWHTIWKEVAASCQQRFIVTHDSIGNRRKLDFLVKLNCIEFASGIQLFSLVKGK